MLPFPATITKMVSWCNMPDLLQFHLQLIGGEPLWRITVFMLCIEHMSLVFSRMRLVLGKERAVSNVTDLASIAYDSGFLSQRTHAL